MKTPNVQKNQRAGQSSVMARRKLAALRVSLQRRRSRRTGSDCTDIQIPFIRAIEDIGRYDVNELSSADTAGRNRFQPCELVAL
jgi:hypothetical protein